MRINTINNTRQNVTHKAFFNIVGDKTLMSKEQVNILRTKATQLGSSEDFIAIGITRIKPEETLQNRLIVHHFGNIEKVAGSYTKITAAIHTFFDIDKPDSYIKGVADVYGSRIERASKSFDIISSYLDDIDIGLRR